MSEHIPSNPIEAQKPPSRPDLDYLALNFAPHNRTPPQTPGFEHSRTNFAPDRVHSSAGAGMKDYPQTTDDKPTTNTNRKFLRAIVQVRLFFLLRAR